MLEVIPINTKNLGLFVRDMHEFNVAGCRLIVPRQQTDGFLIHRLNKTPNLPASRDNLIIAPYGLGELDVQVYEHLIGSSFTRAEIVKPNFFLTPEKVVSIGDLDYIIYPDSRSLDSPGSLLYDRQVYLVNFRDMLATNSIQEVSSFSLH